MRDVGKRGWFVVTLDQKIRYRMLEQKAVRESRVGMFVLVRWKGSTGASLAAALSKARPAMLRFISTHRRPFIVKVYSDGRLSLWVPSGGE